MALVRLKGLLLQAGHSGMTDGSYEKKQRLFVGACNAVVLLKSVVFLSGGNRQ